MLCGDSAYLAWIQTISTRPSPGFQRNSDCRRQLIFGSWSRASPARCIRLFATKSTASGARRWPMRFATLRRTRSRSNWSMPTTIFGFSSATMVPGSTNRCCVQGERDIGVCRGCASGRSELEQSSKSGAGFRAEQRSNCMCPAMWLFGPACERGDRDGFRDCAREENRGIARTVGSLKGRRRTTRRTNLTESAYLRVAALIVARPRWWVIRSLPRSCYQNNTGYRDADLAHTAQVLL